MKVTLTVDGRPFVAEVDLAGGTVVVDGRSHALKVVQQTANKVELEIDGEKALVEEWYATVPSPTDPVAVNGERHTITAQVEAHAPARSMTLPPSPASRPSEAAVEPTGTGVAIVPPMPGKVVELRVADGESVRRGQVLLVLEAMKMRNEVASPADGRVADLKVQTGSNVRARETMLRVVPTV